MYIYIENKNPIFQINCAIKILKNDSTQKSSTDINLKMFLIKCIFFVLIFKNTIKNPKSNSFNNKSWRTNLSTREEHKTQREVNCAHSLQ